MHRRSVELYTVVTILSQIGEGDSLSDIQMKTGLTFVTVQKTVRELENAGVIRTRINTTDRGRARECIKVSPIHKKIAAFYKDFLLKTDSFFKNSRGDEINPLLFKLVILENCLNEIKRTMPEETAKIFDEWLKSDDGTIAGAVQTPGDFYDVKGKQVFFHPENFSVRAKAEKGKVEEKKEKKVTLDMFGA